MKKIFRVSTALFLCFVMLLYTGPMQVAASGLAGALYQIAGNIGVNAALRAIGVGPGNSPDAFNTLVTNILDALAPVSNFMTDVLIAGTSGNWLTFLRGTFLQAILDYIYDQEIVVTGFPIPPDASPSLVNIINSAATYKYALFCEDTRGYYYTFYNNDSPFSLSVDEYGRTVVILENGGKFYFNLNTGSVYSVDNYMFYPVSSVYFGTAYPEPITTTYDLTLDAVAPSLDDDPYIPWVENSISNNGETFVPVSLPSTDSSVVSSQTQTQAQAGTATDAVVDEIIAGSDVVPDTGTGTIADVIAAIKAIPASLADFFADVVAAVQAIPAAIADIFSPAADPEAYQVDLKDFFPFCIPFDLFDIVTAFAAEPEAPVFEWPISVPRWGFEYTLKVDLQEWEDIASLFRTLELTIFCVGLAIVTREKFLRS